MNQTRNVFDRIGCRLRIMQAPMAGVNTPTMVAAASNAGCVGSYGVGLLAPNKLRDIISTIRSLTSKPFNINVFALEDAPVNLEQIQRVDQVLRKYREELSLETDLDRSMLTGKSILKEQLEVLKETKPPIVSFCFGLLSEKDIDQLKQFSIVMGTATTVEEAIMLEGVGVDAVIAQGAEAGGHRGSFAVSYEDGLIGTMALIPQIVDAVNVPVVAAGGIMDGRGIVAAEVLGASGVSMGTAFLATRESGASEAHKQILTSELNGKKFSATDAILTSAFTGKMARGIRNRFTREMKAFEYDLPQYQIHGTLTADIRSAGGADMNSFWCGQGAPMAKLQSIQELVNGLELQISSARNQLTRKRV
jgi:nitronate monooxygenase